MNNKEYILALTKATCVSILIFIFTTFLSYFLDLEYKVNFKIGLPWTFYYQFLIDCEVQHGSDIKNFIKDAGLTWICTTMIWLVFRRAKN